MSFAEIEHEALALPESQRAALVAALLGTLPAPGSELSDAEAIQRDVELESGQAEGVLHEDFIRRIERERGQ